MQESRIWYSSRLGIDIRHEEKRITNKADCHDHRALHPPDKGVHPASESTRGKAAGRCAYRPSFTAQSAVQPKPVIVSPAFHPPMWKPITIASAATVRWATKLLWTSRNK